MLKAEVSIPVALATTALVWGVYQISLPTIAEARAATPNDGHLQSAETSALILAVGIAGGISILARDSTPFVVGGLVACALSWVHRKANQTNPTTQKLWNADQFAARRYTIQSE